MHRVRQCIADLRSILYGAIADVYLHKNLIPREDKVRNNVYTKSTLRQPLRTVLLFVLIGAVSFAFLSRMVEYIAIARETDKLSGYYWAIGTLKRAVTNEPAFSEEIAQLISKSEYVSYDDRLRYNSGALVGILNADISSFGVAIPELSFQLPIHISDVLFYATLDSIAHMKYAGGGGYYSIDCYVDSIVTGHAEFASEGHSLSVSFHPEYWGKFESQFEEMEVGSRYLIRAYRYPANVYGGAELVMRMRPLVDDGPLFLRADPGSVVDFTAPEFVQLESEIELIRENLRAMCVWSTRDMSAMEDVQESSMGCYLLDGRWIDYDDDLSGSRVCVVNRKFAGLRDLSVGDTVKLLFRKLDKHFFGYIAFEDEIAGWREYPTYEDEFEIVGIYDAWDSSNSMLSHVNCIYIPDSALPVGFEGDVYKYSFVLKSSRYKEAFLAETEDALAEFDLSASFQDNGFEHFWESASQIRQSTILNAIVFGVVAVMALAMSAFLYLRMRRKEFAILRALGTPTGAAVRKMLTPIAIVGAAAAIAGGLLSWDYTLDKAAETLSVVAGPEGVAISAELPSIWLVGLCGGLLVLLVLFVLFGSLLMSKRPVLGLLGSKS